MSAPTNRDEAGPPSRLWYFLVPAVFAVYFGALFLIVPPIFENTLSGLNRMVLPGEAEFTLEDDGGYIVFQEYRSVVDGVVHESDATAATDLRVTLTGLDTGVVVPLTTSDGNINYSLSGWSGASVFTFEIAAPDRYRLTAAYDDGRADPKTVLAVSRDRTVWLILGGLVVMFTGFGLAIAAAIAVWRRRKPFRPSLSGKAFVFSVVAILVWSCITFGWLESDAGVPALFAVVVGSVVVCGLFGAFFWLLCRYQSRIPEPVILMFVSTPYAAAFLAIIHGMSELISPA